MLYRSHHGPEWRAPDFEGAAIVTRKMSSRADSLGNYVGSPEVEEYATPKEAMQVLHRRIEAGGMGWVHVSILLPGQPPMSLCDAYRHHFGEHWKEHDNGELSFPLLKRKKS